MSRVKPQEAVKKAAGKCAFCDESAYECLEAHRIVPGCQGGKYKHRENLVVLCANHHSKVHLGTLRIHRRYDSTGGPVLHITEDGVDYFHFELTGRRVLA